MLRRNRRLLWTCRHSLWCGAAHRPERCSIPLRAYSRTSPEGALKRTNAPVTNVVCDDFDLQVPLTKKDFRPLYADPPVPIGESDSGMRVEVLGKPSRRKPGDFRRSPQRQRFVEGRCHVARESLQAPICEREELVTTIGWVLLEKEHTSPLSAWS